MKIATVSPPVRYSAASSPASTTARRRRSRACTKWCASIMPWRWWAITCGPPSRASPRSTSDGMRDRMPSSAPPAGRRVWPAAGGGFHHPGSADREADRWSGEDCTTGSAPVFHPVRAPTAEQLQTLLTRIIKRLMRLSRAGSPVQILRASMTISTKEPTGLFGSKMSVPCTSLKMSAHMSDHHVPSAEFGGGMSRFKSPFSHR
jgi:hypothetical protein